MPHYGAHLGAALRAVLTFYTRKHACKQVFCMSSHQTAPRATSMFAELRHTANTRAPNTTTRIALVLSGGGLRGAGHIGVLEQLIAHDIPIDVIVGSSAGAIVAAYYAAVGLTLDELVRDARHFRGRHIIAHSLNVRLHHRLDRVLGKLSGLIPSRLEQLERATFDRLHHGIRAVGVVCHDLRSGRPRYFATGRDHGVRFSEVVRASASIPFLFPSAPVKCAGEELLLTDGGVSDCLPIAFARQPPLSATASHRIRLPPACNELSGEHRTRKRDLPQAATLGHRNAVGALVDTARGGPARRCRNHRRGVGTHCAVAKRLGPSQPATVDPHCALKVVG